MATAAASPGQTPAAAMPRTLAPTAVGATDMDNQQIKGDPRAAKEQPPFPHQEQEHPGREGEMAPAPDFGEATYKGYGRLEGKVALITGADSGIGRAVAL